MVARGRKEGDGTLSRREKNTNSWEKIQKMRRETEKMLFDDSGHKRRREEEREKEAVGDMLLVREGHEKKKKFRN